MRYFFLPLLLIAFGCCSGKDLISVKVSKPLCVLTFLQTAGEQNRHMSSTLRAYIYDHLPAEDTDRFAKLVARFRSIDMEYTFVVPGFPDSRVRSKSILSFVTIAAVQSGDIDDFMQRIIGLLPNEQWLELKSIMEAAAPYFDKMLGVPYGKELDSQAAALQQYSNAASKLFDKLRLFYGSSWTQDIPFTVGVYGIPGKKGNTTASPYSNSLVVGVLTEEDDHEMRMGVAIHEMCHVLYAEQPVALQQQLERWFNNDPSPSSAFAYSYLNEGLATACGNGWAYEILAGHADTTEWYSNVYIDGYAHALYPMVKRYLQNNRQIDSEFVKNAIQLFGSKFPNAHRTYDNLLNDVSIYTDAKDPQQFNSITSSIAKYFRVSNSNGTYPITDPQTLSQLGDAKGTQLFIVYTSHEANFRALKAKFPELKDKSSTRQGVISFFDHSKRAVIIINAMNKDQIERCLAALSKAKEIDPKQAFLPVGK